MNTHIGDEFEVMYFSHWASSLYIHVLTESKSKLARGMRIRKANPQDTGPYFVSGSLEVITSNPLEWEYSTVRWDGEVNETLVNHWQIQPETDPIPDRNKCRKSKPRRSNTEASTSDIQGTKAIGIQH
ncbi:hypothetical protein RYX36_006870 [Vicia faba]